MTAQKLVVADTGPLLCAGAFQRSMGTTLIHKRRGRLYIPASVEAELRGLAKPSTDGTKSRVVVNAAKKMLSPGPFSLLKVDMIARSSSDQTTVRDAIIDAETNLAIQRGRTPKLHGHVGEVDAILLAESQDAILLTNDHAALVVARRRGIEVATYAGLLAADLKSKQFTAVEAIEECRRVEADVYCGLRRLDALLLTNMPYPTGL